VVAPTCGFYSEQGPVLGYVHDDDLFDPASLEAAVTAAYRDRGRSGRAAGVEQRRLQRREIAAAHDRLYASVAR